MKKLDTSLVGFLLDIMLHVNLYSYDFFSSVMLVYEKYMVYDIKGGYGLVLQ